MISTDIGNIAIALYGFAEALQTFEGRSDFVYIKDVTDSINYIGDVYHEHTDRRITMIKIVRACTDWQLVPTKNFLEECERYSQEGNDIINRLAQIVEDN